MALFSAQLTPSKELGLIKPAASPSKKTPFPPMQNCRQFLGRNTWQASVFTGAPNRKPRLSSARFWSSNRRRQSLGG